jgi:hypothetical protein
MKSLPPNCLLWGWILAYSIANASISLLLSTTGRISVPELTSSTKIDESFYSRQLLVYGKPAQAKLASSSVIIIGSNGLAEEVVKNLALTGVGRLILVPAAKPIKSPLSIRGEDSTLLQYAKSLNPYIQVALSLASSCCIT